MSVPIPHTLTWPMRLPQVFCLGWPWFSSVLLLALVPFFHSQSSGSDTSLGFPMCWNTFLFHLDHLTSLITCLKWDWKLWEFWIWASGRSPASFSTIYSLPHPHIWPALGFLSHSLLGYITATPCHSMSNAVIIDLGSRMGPYNHQSSHYPRLKERWLLIKLAETKQTWLTHIFNSRILGCWYTTGCVLGWLDCKLWWLRAKASL